MRAGGRFCSETELVGWLRRTVSAPARGLLVGIGDDAALVRPAPGREMILKADLSMEGVHFLRTLHPAGAIGHRALARPLSDLAAMGARPRFALVTLALPKDVSRAWIEQFYAGLRALARHMGVAVVGGDTARSPAKTMVDVMVVGEVPRGQALRRSGARPGDQIFVSGCLGTSALGLRLLKLARRPGHRAPAGAERNAVHAHLYPEPRCALGRYLSSHRLASACIDVSDGLSSDLHRLCGSSHVGARLWEAMVPVPGASLAARGTALALALHGGEDYELLFTVPANQAARLRASFRGLPLTRIGEIRRGRGVLVIDAGGCPHALPPAGYDHFRRRSGAPRRRSL